MHRPRGQRTSEARVGRGGRSWRQATSVPPQLLDERMNHYGDQGVVAVLQNEEHGEGVGPHGGSVSIDEEDVAVRAEPFLPRRFETTDEFPTPAHRL